MENLYEKKEAGPALRKVVTIMENQTNQKVKCIRIDQGREFKICKQEFWQAEKGIKIEYTVAYSSEINRIAK